MDWQCCDRCQKWASCDTKWYRGEKGIPQYCCPNCENYGKCYDEYKRREEERKNKKPDEK